MRINPKAILTAIGAPLATLPASLAILRERLRNMTQAEIMAECRQQQRERHSFLCPTEEEMIALSRRGN